MSPLTHLVGSWLIASVTTDNSRDRKLVTLAGILPDVDGLGMVADVAVSAVSGRECTFVYYQQYHHVLTHGWPGALVVSALLVCFARHRWPVAALCLAVFHLHLLCDLIGSRGPTAGDIWPIYYSEPWFHHPIWYWNGQWRLDGWQNQCLSIALLGVALGQAIRRGFSFVELVSPRADRAFVRVLQKWRSRFS